MSAYVEMLNDPELKADVVGVLAEFFQDSFKDDAAGVGDWLAQNGTSVDLFVKLVEALRSPQGSDGSWVIAEQLIKAVNNHDALIDALETACEYLESEDDFQPAARLREKFMRLLASVEKST